MGLTVIRIIIGQSSHRWHWHVGLQYTSHILYYNNDTNNSVIDRWTTSSRIHFDKSSAATEIYEN